MMKLNQISGSLKQPPVVGNGNLKRLFHCTKLWCLGGILKNGIKPIGLYSIEDRGGVYLIEKPMVFHYFFSLLSIPVGKIADVFPIIIEVDVCGDKLEEDDDITLTPWFRDVLSIIRKKLGFGNLYLGTKYWNSLSREKQRKYLRVLAQKNKRLHFIKSDGTGYDHPGLALTQMKKCGVEITYKDSLDTLHTCLHVGEIGPRSFQRIGILKEGINIKELVPYLCLFTDYRIWRWGATHEDEEQYKKCDERFKKVITTLNKEFDERFIEWMAPKDVDVGAIYERAERGFLRFTDSEMEEFKKVITPKRVV